MPSKNTQKVNERLALAEAAAAAGNFEAAVNYANAAAAFSRSEASNQNIANIISDNVNERFLGTTGGKKIRKTKKYKQFKRTKRNKTLRRYKRYKK